MKILSIICIRSYCLGRLSRDCRILQAWQSVVGFYCGWGWYSENSCIVLEGGRSGLL